MEEIRDIKKILKRISSKLMELEEKLSSQPDLSSDIGGNSVRLFRRLIELYYMIIDYVDRGEKIYEMVEGDDIKVWIIKTLYQYGEMNILQLTNAIRKKRGKGSRRIVAKKLEELEKKNIVRKRIVGREKIYYLNI